MTASSNNNDLTVRVDQQVGLLNWNFEELNMQLDRALEKYVGLQFDDSQMKDAKKIRAELNKLAKSINDRKLAVKKEFCAPYVLFEDQAKQLIEKVKKVSGDIDVQIKEYEGLQKAARHAEIKHWWEENGPAEIPLEKVFDPKFLNQTCSTEDWQNQLQAEINRFRNEMALIMEFTDQERREFVLADYMQNLDMFEALERWNEHQAAKQAAERAQHAMEAERIRQEETQRQIAELMAQSQAQSAAPEPDPVQTVEAPAQQEDPNDYLYSPTFRLVDATYLQAMDITRYMKSNGIRYVSVQKFRRKKD